MSGAGGGWRAGVWLSGGSVLDLAMAAAGSGPCAQLQPAARTARRPGARVAPKIFPPAGRRCVPPRQPPGRGAGSSDRLLACFWARRSRSHLLAPGINLVGRPELSRARVSRERNAMMMIVAALCASIMEPPSPACCEGCNRCATSTTPRLAQSDLAAPLCALGCALGARGPLRQLGTSAAGACCPRRAARTRTRQSAAAAPAIDRRSCESGPRRYARPPSHPHCLHTNTVTLCACG